MSVENERGCSKHKTPNDGVPPAGGRLDLVAIREKLNGARGREFWRTLEELAGTAEYAEWEAAEFPGGHLRTGDSQAAKIGRRDALKLMAASAALCGLAGCTKLPNERIVPYATAPEEVIPGKPLFYATSMPDRGSGFGLLVETHSGRPTKVEGNPSHPASLGATHVFAQASVLTLWDPYRSQSVVDRGRTSDWRAFAAAIREWRSSAANARGGGLRILTPTICSPTLNAQLMSLLEQYPEARWHVHEPFGDYNATAGAQMAFGRAVRTVYRFDRADVVLSLDSDFIYRGPAAVRYARDFVSRRSLDSSNSMNRLYVIESALTNTGAMADHRLPMRAGDIEDAARTVALELGLRAGGAAAGLRQDWLEALVRDLNAHRGASVIIAGEEQPPVVHALAHMMNDRLGNTGNTISYIEALNAGPERDSLAELAAEIDAGKVSTLLILDANPAFTAPADLDFSRRLERVKLRIHAGMYADETARLCHWHVPEAHFMEAWGDTRAFDGTAGIIQPVIAPLYNGHSIAEALALWRGDAAQSDYERVRSYWQQQREFNSQKQYRDFWETSVHDGVVADSGFNPLALKPQLNEAIASPKRTDAGRNTIELVFRPDPTVFDGRWANNAWLQELPKPITKLTWDNVLTISPSTASRLGLSGGDVVEMTANGKTLSGPIWIMPGHADNSATITAGYGRWSAGPVGNGAGMNAYVLRQSTAPFIAESVEIKKTGATYPLADSQKHHGISPGPLGQEHESDRAFERGLVRVGTLEEFRRDPAFAREQGEDGRLERGFSLTPGYKYEGYAWGMAIDLNRCIGCSACVIACYAENNIAVVGKSEVLLGRDMQWIRVDNYYRGDPGDPELYFEPVPCMHCENAPCELVCPVGATVHSSEGLNEMIYNRCVGTRYCSNNCPYKVRRFNFKLYSDWATPSLYGLRNPNVTVRSRGVMEKCTYCVQRINAAKITAEKEQRAVRDGEIKTACQQVCPTEAIVFGNINDPNSRVMKRKKDARDYALLAELNTRPRTTYQAKLRNPALELNRDSAEESGQK